MPAIQNCVRRGAVYYFRAELRWPDGNLCRVFLSLNTRLQGRARLRAALLRAFCEKWRMSIFQHSAYWEKADRITHAERVAMFRSALSKARDFLDAQQERIATELPFDPDHCYQPQDRFQGFLAATERLYRDMAQNGVSEDYGDLSDLDRRFGNPDFLERQALAELFHDHPDIATHVARDAEAELVELRGEAAAGALKSAERIIAEARLAAVMEYRRRLADPLATFTAFMNEPQLHAPPRVAPAEVRPSMRGPTAVSPDPVSGWQTAAPIGPLLDCHRWTPIEAAEAFIAANPKTGTGTGEATNAKRQRKTWTDKTRSQFEASARMFQKSYGVRPMCELTHADILRLDDHFNRLPTTHHKSPRHADMTLEEICAEAAASVAQGKLAREKIGLDLGTTNRHYGFLRTIVTWLRKKVPSMAEVDWSAVLFDDDRDARSARAAITSEDGAKLFRLPIWRGSRNERDRLDPGALIFHDAPYWVPLIAWYSGMRREEICKLMVTDIGTEDGIWFFHIADTEAGRTKTRSSKRRVPMADELIRLGLPEFIAGTKNAGETLLFPELLGGSTMGDVFYKSWWRRIAGAGVLAEGVSLHSFRHMVATELKAAGVTEEMRADLLGHKLESETAGRYAKAARLTQLKAVIDQIPVVTATVRAERVNRPRPS